MDHEKNAEPGTLPFRLTEQRGTPFSEPAIRRRFEPIIRNLVWGWGVRHAEVHRVSELDGPGCTEHSGTTRSTPRIEGAYASLGFDPRVLLDDGPL